MKSGSLVRLAEVECGRGTWEVRGLSTCWLGRGRSAPGPELSCEQEASLQGCRASEWGPRGEPMTEMGAGQWRGLYSLFS